MDKEAQLELMMRNPFVYWMMMYVYFIMPGTCVVLGKNL